MQLTSPWRPRSGPCCVLLYQIRLCLVDSTMWRLLPRLAFMVTARVALKGLWVSFTHLVESRLPFLGGHQQFSLSIFQLIFDWREGGWGFQLCHRHCLPSPDSHRLCVKRPEPRPLPLPRPLIISLKKCYQAM